MGNLNAPVKLLICILFSVALLPLQPEGLSNEGYYITVILAGLLLSFFLKPYSMGMMVLFTLVVLSTLKLITFKEALTGFSQSVVWLVIAAFMIAKVIIDSNLGTRIALFLISKFGKSTLTLAYAISFSELIFGPFVASNTARGGGIMSPIVNNKLSALGITPYNDSQNIGQYLIMTATHSNNVTSAMFLTGMAANPLVSLFARDYLKVNFDWLTWALGAIIPGLFALFLLPIALYAYFRPGQINEQKSKTHAKLELKKLGPMQRDEKIVGVIFLGLIIGWISSGWHGLSAPLVAWLGVLGLLFSKSLTWKGFIRNHLAWDALVWLGGLITIITLLRSLKVIDFFIASLNPSWLASLSPLTALLILLLFYLYSMYACTMLTAHIGAFLGSIFVVCAGLNTPPLLTVALFAYFSNLCATLTHYSTGQVVIYYSYNFVKLPTWFGVGFLLSLYHLLIWLGIGLPWWRFLGWW